jgi:hypothetical protein
MNPSITFEPRPALAGTKRSPARMRPAVYVASTLLAIAWSLFAGKDVPWDALHYHLYAGFSALNDRLAIDFFPAGPQTYLNPYSHLPLYLMVRAQWPSLAIGITFACLHSVILWMTYELACAVSRRADGTAPAAVTLPAVALALFNPVLLQEVGSSFNDVTTGTLALGGYVALANAFAGGRLRLVALGGALLGAAAALKLSNAILALVPALVLVLGCAATTRLRLRALLVFAACACLAVLVLSAPWAWRLEQAFRNPFFPMLNDVFNPPDFAKAAIRDPAVVLHVSPVEGLARLFNAMRDPRFLPSSFAEALARPFEMLQARRLIHTETMAADARYVSLLLLPVLGLAALAWRRWRGATAPVASPGRAFACLAAAFTISWVLWLAISGNSRYFLPMACIAGVLLAAGLHRIFAAAPRALAYSLAVVFGVQGLLLWQAADFRWNPHAWDGPWVQATIPPRLQTEPYLYIPMDPQSQSFLLPSLAPGSAFLGLISGAITPEGPSGRRARTLIDANLTRLRILKLVRMLESDGRPVAPPASTFDHPLRRFGLRVDPGDCDYITYKGNADVLERAGPRSGPRDQVYLYTCRVVPAVGMTETELERKRITDFVLDRVEDACPELFPPRGGSFRSGAIWRRNYADVVTWVNDDGFVRFADLIRGGGDFVAIGREEDWLKSPQKLTCWRTEGRAHVELGKR